MCFAKSVSFAELFIDQAQITGTHTVSKVYITYPWHVPRLPIPSIHPTNKHISFRIRTSYRYFTHIFWLLWGSRYIVPHRCVYIMYIIYIYIHIFIPLGHLDPPRKKLGRPWSSPAGWMQCFANPRTFAGRWKSKYHNLPRRAVGYLMRFVAIDLQVVAI